MAFARREEQRRVRQLSRARLFDEALARVANGDEALHSIGLATPLLSDAVREKASDIHLDPADDGYAGRFRINGSLVDTIRLSRERGLPLLRAFKSHADLDPAFSLRPQDGRAALQVADGEASVRARRRQRPRTSAALSPAGLPPTITTSSSLELGMVVISKRSATSAT